MKADRPFECGRTSAWRARACQAPDGTIPARGGKPGMPFLAMKQHELVRFRPSPALASDTAKPIMVWSLRNGFAFAAARPLQGSFARNVMTVTPWRRTAALLPARDAAHVRQLVRDALVAIDAGLLAGEQEALMRLRGARACLVMSIDSALWQLRHSSESLAFSRAHSCIASSSRWSRNFSRVLIVPKMCPRPPWRPASCARSCRSSRAARGSPGRSRARRSGW